VNSVQGTPNISKRAGLSSDELITWSNNPNLTDIAYYTNSLAAPTAGSVAAGHETWTTCYNYIYRCNAAIEGLNESESLTPSVKKQLLGEAKFMRAFLFFYLVNLYGDIPLALSSDYQVNRLLPRAPVTQVYSQMIADLTNAEALLSSNFLNGQLQNYSGSAERVRPTSWAAKALLARVYLFMKNWGKAESYANDVISNSNFFGLVSLSAAFQRAGLGNTEAIWQLQPVNDNGSTNGNVNYWNTEDGRLFVLNAAPAGINTTHPVYLNPLMLSAFENNDNRRNTWVGSYTDGSGTYLFPNKYKIGAPTNGVLPTEYLTVFRLAEQFLIRAEARAQQNNLSAAIEDVNKIRARAGLSNLSASFNQMQVLSAILHERQVELFSEWGHRWLDLKRTNNVDVIMTSVCPQKGGVWASYKQWYPIPVADIQGDPNLVQNQGY
jgi:hypothetical protein